MLRIEIQTDKTGEDEAYVHDVALDISKVDVILAIETLYGPEGVTSIQMYAVDTEVSE